MVWALQQHSTIPEESLSTPLFLPSTLLKTPVTAFASLTCPPPLCKRSPVRALLGLETRLARPQCFTP